MSFPTFAFKKIKCFVLILLLAQVIEPSMKKKGGHVGRTCKSHKISSHEWMESLT